MLHNNLEPTILQILFLDVVFLDVLKAVIQIWFWTMKGV